MLRISVIKKPKLSFFQDKRNSNGIYCTIKQNLARSDYPGGSNAASELLPASYPVMLD